MKKNVAVIVLTIITLASIVSAASLYKEVQELKSAKTKTESQQVNEVERIKEKVSKLINLPEGPVFVGTYSSDSKLKEQAFFAAAKDGDKYLIFSESGKAMIYRESENKLINVGPITIIPETSTSTTK